MAVHLFTSRRRSAVCGALAACLLLGVAGKAMAATPVQDPERNSMAVTSWFWQDFVSIPTMNSLLSSQNQRIVDLEVDSTSPSLTLSATTVSNATAPYKRTWWWYVGDSISDVNSQLAANNGRLIDLDTYLDGGVRKYAVVMVKNAGKAFKTWWWYVGQTTSQLSALATQNKARITDLQSEGNGRYDAIMIRNGGVDKSAWWWYVHQSVSQLTSLLNANHARLIDLVPESDGTFDAVMVPAGTKVWWWYVGQTRTQIGNEAAANKARIFEFEPYATPSGGTAYMALMIKDS
jgi:hypothetical protein